jgi:hypothetical protein
MSGFLPRKVLRSIPHTPIILICNTVSPELLQGSGMSIRVALPGSCTTGVLILISYFQIVDSGRRRTKNVCALIVAEVRKVAAKDLPPLRVSAGYETYRPI